MKAYITFKSENHPELSFETELKERPRINIEQQQNEDGSWNVVCQNWTPIITIVTTENCTNHFCERFEEIFFIDSVPTIGIAEIQLKDGSEKWNLLECTATTITFLPTNVEITWNYKSAIYLII